MKPQFFIVGAQKSGTTSLYHYLREHPGIFLPDRVEMSFFSDAHLRPTIADLDEYLAFFADSGSRLPGEKSAIYLFSEETAPRLLSFSPDSKIIVMIRHPVDLVASLHRQFLYTGNEDIVDLEEALALEEDRARGRRIPRGAHLVRFLQYRNVARLAPQIQRYYDLFGRDRVRVVLLEDLIESPEDTYRTILEFLGVDSQFKPDFRTHNPAKPVPNLALRRWSRFSRRLNRFIHGAFPRSFVASMRKSLSQLQRQPVYPIPDALYNELLAEFEGDIRELARTVDRDLDHWLSPKGA